MSEGGAGCTPDRSTAKAAVPSGDLCRLRWLRDHGCALEGVRVLGCALQHADLAVAERLTDEAGCELPAAASGWEWRILWTAAVRAPDGVAKLQWLGERGAPPLHEAGDDHLAKLAYLAVEAGRVDVLQHLRSLPRLTPQLDQRLLRHAFEAHYLKSVPMADYLRRAGMELTPSAYCKAAGNLDVVRWLAREVTIRPCNYYLQDLVTLWPRDAPSHSRVLLQAVQLMVEEAGCDGWGVHQAASSDRMAGKEFGR